MRLRRFFEIAKEERRAFLRACVYLAASRILLATQGLAKTRKRLETRRQDCRRHTARAELLAVAVTRAGRHLPLKTTCLDRAVALWWLLAADGLGGALRIGVRTSDGALDAHAWVEHAGVVLLDDQASHYAPFDAPVLLSE